MIIKINIYHFVVTRVLLYVLKQIDVLVIAFSSGYIGR